MSDGIIVFLVTLLGMILLLILLMSLTTQVMVSNELSHIVVLVVTMTDCFLMAIDWDSMLLRYLITSSYAIIRWTHC